MIRALPPKISTCGQDLMRYYDRAMNAKMRFGIMCAFGAMTPVAFAAPVDAEDVAASIIQGYNVSFSGGG